MFSNNKKLFFILFLALILSFFASLALAANKLEIQYPGAGEGELSTFPKYVKYIFNFSIMIAGIIALGVLVFSGIKILTSPDQPSVISDARTKIIGAFIGIIVLLSSYLILTTINPQLTIISLREIKAVSGVILTDSNGKNHYLAEDNLSLNFTPTQVTFLSQPTELISVYDGNDKETVNVGTGSGGSFSGTSIRFLWNRPGIYLYPKSNLGGWPRYFNSSVSSLSNYDFDDKAQSLRFRDDLTNNLSFGAILFSDNDFRGKCGYARGAIGDLSSPGSSFLEDQNPIKSETSSFVLINKTPAQTGGVTFYDSINCTGCKVTISPISEVKYLWSLETMSSIKEFICPDGSKKPVDKNILSLEINGPFGVVLNTKPCFGGGTCEGEPISTDARCQLFTKPAGTTCIPTLKGSYVFNPDITENADRVRSLMIIPLAK